MVTLKEQEVRMQRGAELRVLRMNNGGAAIIVRIGNETVEARFSPSGDLLTIELDDLENKR